MAHKGVTRQTPHRFQTKVKLTKKERELENSNKKLQKQVSRLRKELNKSNNKLIEAIDDTPQIEIPVEETGSCPKCNDVLKNYNLGFKSYRICNNCKYRESL